MILNKNKIKDLFTFLPKAKHKAGKGLEEGKYPFYTSSAVVNKFYDEYDYEPNKLIFATGGSASVHYADSKFAVSTDNFILEPKKDVNAKYVYYYLKNNIQILQDGFHGAGLQHLSKDYLSEITVPILDCIAQDKIVSILDKADEIRQKKKFANDKLDEFLKSTFISMFGDPVKNDRKYPKQALSILCNKITDGTHDTPPRYDSGVMIITGKNIRPFRIDFSQIDYVTEADHKIIYERCNPQYGDILYTNIGVNLGTAVMNNIYDEFSMKNIALLKINEKYLIQDF